jgi:hypothetical protein
MDVIKQTSTPYDTVEDAKDALYALTHLDGYVFGYVDEQKLRTVTFHKVNHSVGRTFAGQQKVTLAFSALPTRGSDLADLKPIADAIFGKTA